MSEQPKYTACISDGEIAYFGQGNTPDEAFNNFMYDGFDGEVDDLQLEPGDIVDVMIYTTLWPDDNGSFNDEMYDDNYQWYCGSLVEERPVTVPERKP